MTNDQWQVMKANLQAGIYPPASELIAEIESLRKVEAWTIKLLEDWTQSLESQLARVKGPRRQVKGDDE